ncbi:hypothetical protein PENTCL1PPCAC_24589 [Pristionchus entomophagus]|uniref:non-specific protein-tyrosine kinase n=1 Tax=Pristionchus entomophagus TaxID=358040 RepID=A0AAV5U888_9BILA|nr:hypothetical protein PENTCL1PPCAC_24589 [Pristionchus entomophagus]
MLRQRPKSRSKKTKREPEVDLPAYMDLDYWHGNLPNEDTANLLKEEDQYLLRKDLVDPGAAPTAATAPDVILLWARSGQQVVSALVKEVPSGFRVGDRKFDTVTALVDYYQIRKIPIDITEDIEVTLGNPVRRKAWELRHKMITIQKELGSGSYGTVYLAQLTYPRQKPITVAAKMLSDMDHDSSLALWKEARVMQEYDHPNITKFYGVCNDAMPYYLVMEFISSGSVDNFLKANPKTSTYKRTKIAMEAAAGLDYLHSRLCIHRDIAARNLLIDKVAKVADFGLTRKTRNYKIDPEKPMNLRWISPEVYETAVVNKATDVYAFGITLYELYVVPYEIPYAQWDADEVNEKVVEGNYRLSPPREAPKEIAGLMRECLLEAKMRPSFRMIHIFLAAQLKKMEAEGLADEGKKKFKLW